jgi:hypothetical protein
VGEEAGNLKQLASAIHILKRGGSVLDYTQLEPFFLHIDVPNVPTQHWTANSGWEMAKALSQVISTWTHACVRVYWHGATNIKTFPFVKVLQRWRAAKEKRGVNLVQMYSCRHAVDMAISQGLTQSILDQQTL